MATKRKRRGKKKPSRKHIYYDVWKSSGDVDGTRWKVVTGRLVPTPGRPQNVRPLFIVVAEKLPYEALGDVRKDMLDHGYPVEGVYLAHDSMGVARYGGRGRVFVRLSKRKNLYPDELKYFSFYIIADKRHEREIETLIIRAAGPQLILNDRKRAVGIKHGAVRDYEPGTEFYESHRAR